MTGAVGAGLRAAVATVVAGMVLAIPAAGAQGPDLRSPEAADDGTATASSVAHLSRRAGDGIGPPGGEVRSLVLAPSDPSRLYLGSANGHVYISRNAARRWRDTGAGLPHDAVVDNIAVHPDDPDRVYAGYWRPQRAGGLLRSRDAGATWERLDTLGSVSVRALALAPSAPEVVYAGGLDGIWRSDDGGDSWSFAGGEGMPFEFVESLAVDPRDPDRVYAGTWRQAFRTVDGGATWHRIHRGMAIDRDVFSIAVSPHDPDRLIAGTCAFVYDSTSGGDRWQERRSGLATYHRRVHVVAPHPHDPERIYAGTRGALYLSEDGGATWRVVMGGIAVSAVAIDPDSGRVYLGTEEVGVLASDDGSRFDERNDGFEASRVVAFDALPDAPEVLFAARSDGMAQDSILYSTDAGRTWTRLGSQPALGKVRQIRAQAEPINHVFVVAEGGWWSVAPGGRWAPVPPAPGEFRTLGVAGGSRGDVVAATDRGLFVAHSRNLVGDSRTARAFDAETTPDWRSLHSGSVAALDVTGEQFIAAVDERIVRGTLGETLDDPGSSGASVRTAVPEGLARPVTGLALDPRSPERAYAIGGNRVHRSDDGGRTWSPLALPWPAARLRSLAVDPVDPDQVLLLDFGGAVLRGHDGGTHWLVLDADRGLARAGEIRLSDRLPGLALVSTLGHGLRVVSLVPGAHRSASPTTVTGEAGR